MIRLSGAVELPCLVWVWVFPVPSSSLPSTLYSLHPAATLTQPSPSLYPAATRWLMKWCRTCLMSTVSTWVADAEGILSSQNTTIHFSNYWIGICTLTQRTVSPSTVLSTVYTISLTYFFVFNIQLAPYFLRIRMHALNRLGCINLQNLCGHHQEEVLRFPKHPQLAKFGWFWAKLWQFKENESFQKIILIDNLVQNTKQIINYLKTLLFCNCHNLAKNHPNFASWGCFGNLRTSSWWWPQRFWRLMHHRRFKACILILKKDCANCRSN